jgi:hypothetical protein
MRTAAPAAFMIGIRFGLTAGIGGNTSPYAKGASYLTNSPDACRNCHIMQETWLPIPTKSRCKTIRKRYSRRIGKRMIGIINR